jgi:predicted transcriptional regulator of viral defense system
MQIQPGIDLEGFLEDSPVFTKGDIDDYLGNNTAQNFLSRVALLARLRRAGRVIMVRRGLFVSVPWGSKPEAHSIDHFSVAARLTPDAVITHHSALEFYGLINADSPDLYYSALRPLCQVEFRGRLYKGVKTPRSLVRTGNEKMLIDVHQRQGLNLSVAAPERALVDIIDRTDLFGGWSTATEILKNLVDLDLDAVVDYTKALSNATTAAKVGYYLASRSDSLLVEDRHLQALSDLKPNQPHYLDRSRRRDGRLVAEWNLMVGRELREVTRNALH